MPAKITVHRPVSTVRRSGHPSAWLITRTGLKFRIPFAPRETELGGLAKEWDIIGRPGRAPLVRFAGTNAETMTMSFLVEAANGSSVEPTLDYLSHFRAQAHLITVVGMSKRERGPWRLDDMKIATRKRQEGTNAITSAVVSLAFIQALDATILPRTVGRGPASGGTKAHPTPRPTATPAKRLAPRYHVVKRGETLSHLAVRYYGHAADWPRIANANPAIRRHPNRVRPGMRLTIPPK